MRFPRDAWLHREDSPHHAAIKHRDNHRQHERRHVTTKDTAEKKEKRKRIHHATGTEMKAVPGSQKSPNAGCQVAHSEHWQADIGIKEEDAC